MNYHMITYAVYLLISIVLTIWVAHMLFKNGHIFLIDIFHGNHELAEAVNKLLLVGFYLLNIGYFVLMMRIYGEVKDAQSMFEILSRKIGVIILLLGSDGYRIVHFLNLYIFYALRKRAKHQERMGTQY